MILTCRVVLHPMKAKQTQEMSHFPKKIDPDASKIDKWSVFAPWVVRTSTSVGGDDIILLNVPARVETTHLPDPKIVL